MPRRPRTRWQTPSPRRTSPRSWRRFPQVSPTPWTSRLTSPPTRPLRTPLPLPRPSRNLSRFASLRTLPRVRPGRRRPCASPRFRPPLRSQSLPLPPNRHLGPHPRPHLRHPPRAGPEPRPRHRHRLPRGRHPHPHLRPNRRPLPAPPGGTSLRPLPLPRLRPRRPAPRSRGPRIRTRSRPCQASHGRSRLVRRDPPGLGRRRHSSTGSTGSSRRLRTARCRPCPRTSRPRSRLSLSHRRPAATASHHRTLSTPSRRRPAVTVSRRPHRHSRRFRRSPPKGSRPDGPLRLQRHSNHSNRNRSLSSSSRSRSRSSRWIRARVAGRPPAAHPPPSRA